MQFIDYTKGPVHLQLEALAPEPKFHVFVEAVGDTNVELYTHSPAYLAPGGIFVSVGPQPSPLGVRGMPRFARYIWGAVLRPRWLGGTPREWRSVAWESVFKLVGPAKEGTLESRYNNSPAPPEHTKRFVQMIADGESFVAVHRVMLLAGLTFRG